jgi:diguanylate cyclase (GGDEF)-like protein
MQQPPIPADENARIATLRSLNILDSGPEERFDRLTRIARTMFCVPIAQVSLIDSSRQWIKSSAGTPAFEAPRAVSFCAHAIADDEIMVVEDASTDQRFEGNPLVSGEPHIRFYVGCPLRVGSHNMGALCLIDTKPRRFSEEEKVLLRDLAALVEENLVGEHLAATDPLTKLANRRGFEAFARHALAMCTRLSRPATLVYFDINFFKQINDWFGHAEGDRALKTFATGLESVFRESDAIARLGGDEFAVLLTDTSVDEARYAVTRMRRWIGEENRLAGRGYEIRFSSGEVGFDPAQHPSIEDMLKEADAAMYKEKEDRAGSPPPQPPSSGDSPT